MSPKASVIIDGHDRPANEWQWRYELATVAFTVTKAEEALDGARRWVERADAGGRLLGAWVSEHGPLGRLFLLRHFEAEGELAEERAYARFHRAPFGAGEHVRQVDQDTFMSFPFMPAITPGAYGQVYEIRDYRLVPGGLAQTVEGWRRALPDRNAVNPIAAVMYAVDGPDRIVHIWPFASMDERVEIRRNLYERGVWPPPGGPANIAEADSIMAWPTEFSPLH